ncbi:hypothetical protein DV26_35635 [Amycolatopsis mediterranei]|uniref:LacI family transcriptional regulator n=1 Tax=Amycolatopsis mediterranei (strain S699) TaxID=713604 RepID=A0A9R0NX20_AMYMS|nr:hypothetical protein RAM_18625 [Amycolatopsis mediterranei S699]KDO06022.1 hypothetical protein DV26_35635 [Amycolatopsis mediterranei]KDU88837.1 hypothetical protein DV36_28245 [Amycolatopsis mediterranei]
MGCGCSASRATKEQPTSAYAAGEVLLRGRGVDAIYVANDEMALGVYRAFCAALGAFTVDLLSGDGVPGSRLFTPELVVRRSTAR